MATADITSLRVSAGWLLVISALVFLVAGFLFTARAIWKWPVSARPAYLPVERGFVLAALLIAVVGLTLLERMLEAAGDTFLALAGWALLLVAAGVITSAETLFASRQEWAYGPVVAFVVLAFLAQALFGAALLRTGLLPAWVGWAAIVWNLGCLVVMPIIRPKDMYYPWLHFVAPLLIGIALLVRR